MRTVHVDYTNPRKPYAITNDDESGKPNAIPEDAQTALGLMRDEIANITHETRWLIENGEMDGAKEIIKNLQSFADTIRERVG
ncbi:hypothetical protein NMG46_29405 [Mesorhizobium sp. LMG 17147]|uniref:hypothetical protein n=1 Tax=Mesorhizobium sp. LMG 17147 TaxID=2963091 RepID=UPI0020CA23F2|nr:hypothetical protein [Mesorhizobium sp. LMG 17147]MCP9234262.1 hypothetical protein [Mesorhizobium sp. LMG 17147]